MCLIPRSNIGRAEMCKCSIKLHIKFKIRTEICPNKLNSSLLVRHEVKKNVSIDVRAYVRSRDL